MKWYIYIIIGLIIGLILGMGGGMLLFKPFGF